MSNAQQQFTTIDLTQDESGILAQLQAAVQPGTWHMLVSRAADDDGCGELYIGEQECSELDADDIVVLGETAEQLVNEFFSKI